MPHCYGGSSAGTVSQRLIVPGVPGKNHQRVIVAFQKAGFGIVREGRHTIMSNGTVRLEIPRHNPINASTMASLVRKAGLTREQFEELY